MVWEDKKWRFCFTNFIENSHKNEWKLIRLVVISSQYALENKDLK